MQQLGIPGNKIKTVHVFVFEPLQKVYLPQQVRLEEKVRGSTPTPNPTAGSSPGPSAASPGPSAASLQCTSPTPRLMETSALPTPTTPGSKMYLNISDKSKADYSVYVIKDQNKVVAVLMETKLTSSSKFQHALAQVRSNIIVWGWGVSSLLTCRSLATI